MKKRPTLEDINNADDLFILWLGAVKQRDLYRYMNDRFKGYHQDFKRAEKLERIVNDLMLQAFEREDQEKEAE